jgi:uncharacterized protein (DUF1697 family)
MARYVAFLRGINSGKNSRVKMKVLRQAFENMGFDNVRTVIASGNIVFETSINDIKKLERKIERTLPRAIGFKSDTIVFKLESVRELAGRKPFKSFKLNPQARRYVTFVKGESKGGLKFPFEGKGFTILEMYGRFVCSVVDPAHGKTTDLMRELDKMWKVNTTRGWNTIERILK